jgi:glycosyltransferase involved in cell wall biosynthesis
MRMLEDEDLRHRCMEKSYDLLKKQFTVEKMAYAYENLYREVMGAKCQ